MAHLELEISDTRRMLDAFRKGEAASLTLDRDTDVDDGVDGDPKPFLVFATGDSAGQEDYRSRPEPCRSQSHITDSNH
jgi:hypothetical protein